MNKDHRPSCLNEGCEKPVAWSGTRWRPVCSMCHVRGYKNLPLAEGVTAFKTGYCSNKDGRLGFECPIDYDAAPWAVGVTQIDHIDGDHLNNVPENCMELCDMCHKQKGKLAGDFRKQNRYTYNKKSPESIRMAS